MALRRAVILVLVWAGVLAVLQSVPPGYKWAWLGGGCLLVAYIYAQLTKPLPKGPLPR